MNFLIGLVAPAAIAAALVWLIRQAVRPGPEDRYVFATACGAAVFLGYLLIPGFAELAPSSRWQWLPYVAVTATIVSWLPARGGALGIARWMLITIAAVLAAWKLVPTWDDLLPPRPVSVALVTCGLAALTCGLELLPDRLSGKALPGLLALVAATIMVVLVAAAISLKYAQVAGLMAGALTGCWLAGLRSPVQPAAIRGLVPIFAMYLGGLAYTGCIEKQPPIVAMLFFPLAPLALWLCAGGPLARLPGRVALAVQIVVILIPLVICGAIACIPPAQAEW